MREAILQFDEAKQKHTNIMKQKKSCELSRWFKMNANRKVSRATDGMWRIGCPHHVAAVSSGIVENMK
jgi:hypothetical protein